MRAKGQTARGREKKKNPRNGAAALDLLHIGLGFIIVSLGILVFLNPERHMSFFPVIFILGAVLNAADGCYSRKLAARGRRGRRAGWLSVGVASRLLAAGILSALGIWR